MIEKSTNMPSEIPTEKTTDADAPPELTPEERETLAQQAEADAPIEVTIPPAAPKPPKRRKHRRARGGAAPDVGPAPLTDGPAPAFDGLPPGDLPFTTSNADEVHEERREPAAAPAKGAKRRKPVDPKKVAAKVTASLDGLSVFVATRRYGNLSMTIPGTNETIPIAAMAAATPKEREEVEEALIDVIEELVITLTAPQAAALAILAVYGKRWWSMEQTANALHGHLKAKAVA